MDKQTQRESLLLEVIHLINQKFKNQAILKGGMYLRLLNSPRHTRDVDYVFPTKVSRKVILKEIKSIFEPKGIQIIKKSLNSRGIQMKIQKGDIDADIEISVVKELSTPPEQYDTSKVAERFNVVPEIVTVMSMGEAFSNKIAAALERDVVRDLFDITVLMPLTTFNSETLNKRLSSLCIKRQKPISIDFKEAAKRLKEKADRLTREELANELTGVIPPEFIKGGGVTTIKSTLYRLCQMLENG